MKKISPYRDNAADSADETGPPEPDAPRGESGVEALIRRFEEQIATEDCRISVGDYIRLLQLAKEQRFEEARNVEVRWIDSPELQREPSGEE